MRQITNAPAGAAVRGRRCGRNLAAIVGVVIAVAKSNGANRELAMPIEASPKRVRIVATRSTGSAIFGGIQRRFAVIESVIAIRITGITTLDLASAPHTRHFRGVLAREAGPPALAAIRGVGSQLRFAAIQIVSVAIAAARGTDQLAVGT